jgi:2-polyprenyl-3-methyl-5-hydroxy-6-metoxy-1,4-benzoquinol methylase
MGIRKRCLVCGTPAPVLSIKHGRFSDRDFVVRRCPDCRLAFMEDPWTDYARIYDSAYYDGDGADPLVDYRFELAHPDRTIRVYEWMGLLRVVQALSGATADTRWLDYGAGNGGLVRHVRATLGAEILGFDDGAIVAEAQALGIPFLSSQELDEQAGTFDVVTAIEVLEHLPDPLAELRRMRRLLRPGGLLLLTTGNAEPYAERFAKWRYVIPEIHIAYFEPMTLDRALALAGFRPERLGCPAGFNEIMKFKVLKNLRVRRRSRLTDAIPSAPLALAGDRIAHVSDLRIGWARAPDDELV